MLRVTISQLSIVLILLILLCSELAKASKIQKDVRLSEFENAKRSSGKASRCICGFVSFKCCKRKRSSVVEPLVLHDHRNQRSGDLDYSRF